MDITGKKLVVIGGAGLIGSHTVDKLIKEDVKEVLIYDNFVRGRTENLADALKILEKKFMMSVEILCRPIF